MEKMTNKQALVIAVNVLADAGFEISDAEMDHTIDKLNAMIDALDKKTANKKPTAKQQENECIKQKILDLLANSEPMKCGDIGVAVAISPNQASALLSQLVKAGAVDRFAGEKNVSMFRIHSAE